MVAKYCVIFCIKFHAFLINESESFLTLFIKKLPSLSNFSLKNIVNGSWLLSIDCLCFEMGWVTCC